MIDVFSGTVNPAFSAIHCGLWPTTVGLSFAPAQFSLSAVTPKMNSSSMRFSSAVAM